MNYSRYRTPEERLNDATSAVIKQMRRSNLSRETAAARLFAAIAEDADLWLALIRKERAMPFIFEHIDEVEQRDFDGSALALRPVTKTGGDAVADETGHFHFDTLSPGAPSSAPQSQTPAEKPVGGGHTLRDPQTAIASPSTHVPWSKADIARSPAKVPDLAEERAKRQVTQNKPAVSAAMVRRVANRHAKVFLNSIKCNGKTLGSLTAGEALSWVESVGKMEKDKISRAEKQIHASKARLVEVHVAEVLAFGLPPEQNIEEFYEYYPEEYQKRMETLRATA